MLKRLSQESLPQLLLEKVVTFSDVRQTANSLDNFGGFYDRIDLNKERACEFLPQGILKSSLVIDPKQGHLMAQVDSSLSAKLLNAYRSEIESHLTEEGRSSLQLPENIGFVVVAYKDELGKLPSKALDEVLSKHSHVNLCFNSPYIVPVRGDNRYALVASTLIDSPDMTKIRGEMGLKPLYSENRPLRFTFGAVRNEACTDSNEAIVARLRRCTALAPWFSWIENKSV